MVWVATWKLWTYKNLETSVMIWKTCTASLFRSRFYHVATLKNTRSKLTAL